MPLPVEPGQVLAGKYKVERVLGEGGMGVVLLAQDLRLERAVAIKFLLPDLARHKEAAARFLREARAAVKIQSEHSARIIDVDTMPDETPYMVMEYLEGKDLERTIAERGPLGVSEVCSWVIQACEAIAEAHAQRIVHRDLKPANLFLARQTGGSEIVKVLDFGISKQSTQGPSPSLTRTSAMLGSPLYMSPEQMRSTRDVDSRTDIWALGAILHEALSGKPPFEGESIPQLSAQILLDEPPRLEMLRPEVPKALADIVWCALRKDPAERFANVGELASALLPFAHRRTHTNLERIQRVLSASGMLTQPLAFSDAPGPAASDSAGQAVRITGHEATVPPSGPAPAPASAVQGNSAPRSLAPKGRTVANFGQTSDNPERGPKRRRWAFAAAGVLLVAGGAAAFFRGVSPAAHTTPLGPAAVATLTPGPDRGAAAAEAAVSVSVNAAEPAAPAPTAEAPAATASADAVASVSALAATGAAPRAVATAATKPAARPARARPTASPGSASTSSTTTTTTRHTTSESSTYSGTFKSKFGSRK